MAIDKNNVGLDPSVDILLIEDDDADAELFMLAVNGTILNRISRVADGQSAMNLLHEYKNNTEPKAGLIFLDLNIPKIDGRELLKFIKTDEQLKSIPVIVMTTSSINHDIVQSYADHANCFVKKPLDYNEFASALKSLKRVWLQIVTLPD